MTDIVDHTQFSYPIQNWVNTKLLYGAMFKPYHNALIADRIRMNMKYNTMPLSECPITRGFIITCLEEWNPKMYAEKTKILMHPAGDQLTLVDNEHDVYIICLNKSECVISYRGENIESKLYRSIKIDKGEVFSFSNHSDNQTTAGYLLCYA